MHAIHKRAVFVAKGVQHQPHVIQFDDVPWNSFAMERAGRNCANQLTEGVSCGRSMAIGCIVASYGSTSVEDSGAANPILR